MSSKIFWETRADKARLKSQKAMAELLEMETRERAYVDALLAERAQSKALRAQLAALTGGEVPPAVAAQPEAGVASAGGNEEVARLRKEHEAELTAVAQRAETELQSAAAFWVERTQQLEGRLAASEAAPAVAAQPEVSAEVGGDVVARLREAHEAELAAAAQRAETELQTAAAFWVGRSQQLERRAAASEATAALLRSELEAREERAERELQSTAAYWIGRERSLAQAAREAGAAEAALRSALEERELRAERELQATAAFWLGRVAEAQKAAAAAPPEVKEAAAPAKKPEPRKGGWQPAWKTW